MFTFIREALAEFEHVVWPTQSETRKYMYYTVGVIVVLGIILSVLGYGIREALSFARSQVPHTAQTMTASGADMATKADVDALLNKYGQTASGSSGSSSPTVTNAISATGSAQ